MAIGAYVVDGIARVIALSGHSEHTSKTPTEGKAYQMNRLTKRRVAVAATSVALLATAGMTPASAAKAPKSQSAQCILGGEMFISGAPKGTVSVDYYSAGVTVKGTESPRYAQPTLSFLQPGDWIYVFALDANNQVLSQNLHVVCKY